MSNEIHNPLLAIENGLIHPFVGRARAKGYPEEKITEAAIIGIGKNIKNYEELIGTTEQGIKNYRGIGDNDNTIAYMGKVHEYQGLLEDAKRALEILNEGYEVVYKSEIINPL